MLNYFAKKIFGSSNDRVLKKFNPIVEKINNLEKMKDQHGPELLMQLEQLTPMRNIIQK